MYRLRVVSTTPSKPATFASVVTREQTTLSDRNGVWQKDRGGKFNNYLNVELRVEDLYGQPIALERYYPVEAELRVVMEDNQLGAVIDRVTLESRRIQGKHLEGQAGKLMIIDADPDPNSLGGIRVGGTSTCVIKTRINELSKRGSRNSRFAVVYRVIGPAAEFFVKDDHAACSFPLTIYSKVVRPNKDDDSVNDHLEHAKKAAKTLLSEVEKVDPARTNQRESQAVFEILEACRLIQRKLQWQQAARQSSGAGGAAASSSTAAIFDAMTNAASAVGATARQMLMSPNSSSNEAASNNNGSSASKRSLLSKDNSASILFPNADFSILSSSRSLMTPTGDEEEGAKRVKVERQVSNNSEGLNGWDFDSSRILQTDLMFGEEGGDELEGLEDYIKDIDEDDEEMHIGTSFNITEKGLSIELFDENQSGGVNHGELKRFTLARLNIPLTEEMHKRIFEDFDANKDGVITMQEFVDGLKAKEAELIPLFAKIDADGDGYLTFEELRSSPLLQSLPDEAIHELIAFVDSLSPEERDGRISQREFISTFTMLPSGDALANLHSFAQHVSSKRSASSSSLAQ